MKKYKAVFIGFAHVHAPGFLQMFGNHELVELTACADLLSSAPSVSMEEGTRGNNLNLARDAFGMKGYPDAATLFKHEAADIVLSCAENARHGEVAQLAAAHGCHCVLEKPMATSLGMAREMVRVMSEAGKKLVINWPTSWAPELRLAEALIRAGAIGRVLKFRHMNGSSLGPFSYGQNLTEAEKAAEWWYREEDGGGAFLDYCGYGCLLSTWLIGQKAEGAMAMKANLLSPYGTADDNGLMFARFPGALATLEGTWSVMHAGEYVPAIVYGEAGTMVARRDRVDIFRSRFSHEPDETHEVEPLPGHRDNLAKEVIHCLDTGELLHPTLDMPLNLDAMALLDSGLRSAKSGKYETILPD